MRLPSQPRFIQLNLWACVYLPSRLPAEPGRHVSSRTSPRRPSEPRRSLELWQSAGPLKSANETSSATYSLQRIWATTGKLSNLAIIIWNTPSKVLNRMIPTYHYTHTPPPTPFSPLIPRCIPRLPVMILFCVVMTKQHVSEPNEDSLLSSLPPCLLTSHPPSLPPNPYILLPPPAPPSLLPPIRLWWSCSALWWPNSMSASPMRTPSFLPSLPASLHPTHPPSHPTPTSSSHRPPLLPSSLPLACDDLVLRCDDQTACQRAQWGLPPSFPPSLPPYIPHTLPPTHPPPTAPPSFPPPSHSPVMILFCVDASWWPNSMSAIPTRMSPMMMRSIPNHIWLRMVRRRKATDSIAVKMMTAPEDKRRTDAGHRSALAVNGIFWKI